MPVRPASYPLPLLHSTVLCSGNAGRGVSTHQPLTASPDLDFILVGDVRKRNVTQVPKTLFYR